MEVTEEPKRSRRKRKEPATAPHAPVPVLPEAESEERAAVKATLAAIAAAAAHAHEHGETLGEHQELSIDEAVETTEPALAGDGPDVAAALGLESLPWSEGDLDETAASNPTSTDAPFSG